LPRATTSDCWISSKKPGTATSGGAKTSALFLFATTNSFNGNIRSGMATARLAADVQCSTTRATLTFPDNACTQVRAMISLDAADSMANMPGTYGIPVNISVNGPNNFVIASDWGSLIAGTSGNSLVSVTPCQPRRTGGRFRLSGVTMTGQTTAPAAMMAQPAWVAAEIPILRVTRGYRAARSAVQGPRVYCASVIKISQVLFS
jgi:hypothetical protein